VSAPDIRFRKPGADHAALLLAWRTDPFITRFLFTDLEGATVETQRAWIAANAARDDFRHFMICDGDRPVGYLNFNSIDRRHRRCMTGNYIGVPEERTRIGGLLHAYIMDYCFDVLGMHKVVNEFMAGNDKVVKIQRVLRFREVGTYRDHVLKNGAWHDVHVFEQTREEWAQCPRAVPRDRTIAAFEP
jgi:RimJ/RimL family protein N-acetyltransferase